MQARVTKHIKLMELAGKKTIFYDWKNRGHSSKTNFTTSSRKMNVHLA
jgi:hypothetical protein